MQTSRELIESFEADMQLRGYRLLWLGEKRTKATIKLFFVWFGPERCGRIRFVWSDMWRAYINVSQRFCPSSLLMLERFHIVKKLKEAVDKTRRVEAAVLRRKGDKVTLSKTRWCLLKKKFHTYAQAVRLAELLKLNLRTTRAYLMAEDFLPAGGEGLRYLREARRSGDRRPRSQGASTQRRDGFC